MNAITDSSILLPWKKREIFKRIAENRTHPIVDAIASLKSLTNTSHYEDAGEDTKSRFVEAAASIVKTSGSINTETFHRYYLLPSLNGIKRNKYLLVGLIRCYMDNDYSIEMTSMDYRVSDLLIKKKVK